VFGFIETFLHGVINSCFQRFITISGMTVAKARKKIKLNTNKKAGRE
jgi:hypothetical protein